MFFLLTLPFIERIYRKLTHYVCREHTNRKGGVELQERWGQVPGSR
jgi:hypothetical protein